MLRRRMPDPLNLSVNTVVGSRKIITRWIYGFPLLTGRGFLIVRCFQRQRRLNRVHMLQKEQVRLYLVTDESWLKGQTLADVVEEAVLGGVTMVQYREKKASYEKMREQAVQVQRVCKKYQVPFMINDSVELALALDADGVHLGQEDESLPTARKRLGREKIIGISAHNAEEALRAAEAGADYIGAGAVFGSSTKQNTVSLSPDGLKSICQVSVVPVVGIGGINETNILSLQGLGIDGAAVISAILAKEDVRKAAATMLGLVEKITEKK